MRAGISGATGLAGFDGDDAWLVAAQPASGAGIGSRRIGTFQRHHAGRSSEIGGSRVQAGIGGSKRVASGLKKRRTVRAKSSPVKAALELAVVRDSMKSLAIRVYMTADGEVDRDLLSQLVFLIGMGAEVASNVPDLAARAKALHAALRTLLGMSVAGGHWQEGQARLMNGFAKEGAEIALRHPGIANQVKGSAVHLAARIARGVATMNDVAGVEIYRGVEA